MRSLYLFAHPDDDVLIAGSIFMQAAQGHEVHLAWLTDSSSLGGQERRQKESRQAARVLGVKHCHFLDLPSLELVPNLADGAAQTARLIQQIAPDEMMTVAFEGGHIDHDCINFMVHRARGERPLYEYPLYNGAGNWFHINRFPSGPTLWRALTAAAVRAKHLAMRCYPSQWPYMIPARLATAGRLREPYRECPRDRDHARPPHPGQLNIDRIFNRFMRYRFADFAAAVTQMKGNSNENHER